jgi:hypothetical protein
MPRAIDPTDETPVGGFVQVYFPREHDDRATIQPPTVAIRIAQANKHEWLIKIKGSVTTYQYGVFDNSMPLSRIPSLTWQKVRSVPHRIADYANQLLKRSIDRLEQTRCA